MKKLNREQKIQKVIEILLFGLELEIDGYIYVYHEGKIWIKAQHFSNGVEKDPVLLENHYCLDDFLKICEKVSEEDIFMGIANISLNKCKNKKYNSVM